MRLELVMQSEEARFPTPPARPAYPYSRQIYGTLKAYVEIYVFVEASSLRMTLANVGEASRGGSREPEALLIERYRSRAAHYQPCETAAYRTVDALLQAVAVERRRHATRLILLDKGGEMLESGALATRIGRLQDGGVQVLVAAIGPADGWSRDTLARADMVLSFGRLTLPHRLAQVILAEQMYRALTILAGHPYHCGH